MRLKRSFTAIIFLLFSFSFAGCSKNDTININDKPKPEKLSDKTTNSKPFKNFKGLKMDRESLRIFFEGKDLNLTLPVHVEHNRYYLPLNEIVDNLNGEIDVKEDEVNVSADNSTISIKVNDQTFSKDNKVYKMMKKPLIEENVVYVTLIDLTRMFDLKTNWDYQGKSIALYNNREKLSPKSVSKSGKVALIRLEDISASQTYRYFNEEKLQKLRIVTDYLYSNGIPFHVAWVPKYVDYRPDFKTDNEPARQDNMYNADFVYTLDYCRDRNAVIGLHGYTHQFGNETSIDGFEFANRSNKAPSTDEYALERVNLARESAKALDIPIGFFEAPHYAASPNQLKVFEQNFDYVYEPYSPGGVNGATYVTIRKNENKVSRYIPTPLNYIDGKGDTNNMIRKVNSLKPDVMASFFYHPNIEFEDIKLNQEADGYPSYTYSEQSTLHQVIKAIEAKGYTFESIYDIK